MIRRLFYHFFWNFYDYLGSYLILGALCAGSFLGVLAIASALHSAVHVPAVLLALRIVALVACVIIAGAGLAGTYAFATRAAHEEPARLPDFRLGIVQLTGPYLKLLLLSLFTMAVVCANVVLYIRMAGQMASPFLHNLFYILSMVFVWTGLGVFAYIHVLFATPAQFPENPSLRRLLRKAFILFMLAPGTWLFVAMFSLLLTVVCIVSVIGIIFLLPLIATLSATAHRLLVQHVEFLEQAREELGQRPVAEYKRRARELARLWEEQQPHRGFRELIKPWEM